MEVNDLITYCMNEETKHIDGIIELECRFEIDYSIHDIVKKLNSLQQYSIQKEISEVEYHEKYTRRITYDNKRVEQQRKIELKYIKLNIQGFDIKFAVSSETDTPIIKKQNPLKKKRERYIINNFIGEGMHLHLTYGFDPHQKKYKNSIEIEYDYKIRKINLFEPIKYIFDIMYVKSHSLMTEDQMIDMIKIFNQYLINMKVNRHNTRRRFDDQNMKLSSLNERDEYNISVNKMISFEDKPISLKPERINIVKTNKFYVTNKLNGTRYFMFIYDNFLYLIGKSSAKNKVDLVWKFASSFKAFKQIYILDGEYFENKYYAFDILYEDIDNLGDRHYIFKLPYGERLIKLSLCTNLIGQPVIMKYIVNGYNINDVIDYMKREFKNRWNLDNDGLVFTYAGGVYAGKDKTLKWKFEHHQSVDVKVKKYKDNYYNCFVADRDDKVTPFKEKFLLYSHNKLKEDSIVEVSFDKNKKEFVLMRLRPDKINPNFKTIAEDVWNDIINPIPLTSLSKQFLIVDYDCSWKAYRKLSTGNKTNIIQKYIDSNDILIDIGFGKGGDIDKYIQKGIKYVIGIEPNIDNIKEIEKRFEVHILEQYTDVLLIKSKSLRNNRFPEERNFIYVSIINKSATDVSLIPIIKKLLDRYVSPKITVCMFFSLTYFFNPQNDFVQLISNINKFNPHQIIGTVMDGDKTLSFLNNYEWDESLELGKPKFKMSLENKKNNELYIGIPDSSTVTGHTEYLVLFERFKKHLEWYGYELWEKDYFLFDSNTNCLLSKFASLNCDFCFFKKKDANVNFIDSIVHFNQKYGLDLDSSYFYNCFINSISDFNITYNELIYEIMIDYYPFSKHIVKQIDNHGNIILLYDGLNITEQKDEIIYSLLTKDDTIDPRFSLIYETESNEYLNNKLNINKITNVIYDYYKDNENDIYECIDIMEQNISPCKSYNIFEYNSNVGMYTQAFSEMFKHVYTYDYNIRNRIITRDNTNDKTNITYLDDILYEQYDVVFLNIKFCKHINEYLNDIKDYNCIKMILSSSRIDIDKYECHKLINSYLYISTDYVQKKDSKIEEDTTMNNKESIIHEYIPLG